MVHGNLTRSSQGIRERGYEGASVVRDKEEGAGRKEKPARFGPDVKLEDYTLEAPSTGPSLLTR